MLRTQSELEAIEPRKDFLYLLAELDCMCTVRLRPVVNKIVHSDYVLITDAPPKVVAAIMKAYPYSSLSDGGLLVNVKMPAENEKFQAVLTDVKNDR